MAIYNTLLPDDTIKTLHKLSSEDVAGKMVKAGADVLARTLKATAPAEYLANHTKVSVVYKTPTDGAVNAKAYIAGYIPFSNPNRKYFKRRARKGGRVYSTTAGVPVDFLANLFEYGRSERPFPKKPFLRPALMHDAPIVKAMETVQNKYIK